MRDYYEAELRLLQESAQEFAKAFPEQAGMLNISNSNDQDPYIERLLEGMAFLTAQIRQHIDDDIPEISESLLHQLWPHFLRPYPSTTIINFSPVVGLLEKSELLPTGTKLVSAAPVGDEHVICQFSSTTDVILNPLRLSNVTVSDSLEGGDIFKFKFQLDCDVLNSAIDLSNLKIYIHADSSVAILLLHLLTAKLKNTQVFFPEEPSLQPYYLGEQQSVEASHFGVDESMVPISSRSFHGFHLLQDYFNCREKFMFFTIKGLDEVEWPRSTTEFQVEFKLSDKLPENLKLTEENFLLHCSPAVNLFDCSSEPINFTHERSAYPVVADSTCREGFNVYSVDNVVATEIESGEQTEYFPMHTFQHREKGGGYYYCKRRVFTKKLADTYISLGGISSYKNETLSCTITVSNGDYPRRYIQETDFTMPESKFYSSVSVRNLNRPTAMRSPPDRKSFQWDLISHLSLNYSSLASLDVLQSVLSLYDWSEKEQNSRRIKGVQKIAIEPVNRILKGAMLHGLEIKLIVHEDHYQSVSDIYLYGMVLHHFFSMYAAINCFVSTKIICYPSNKVLTWEPLNGKKFPI